MNKAIFLDRDGTINFDYDHVFHPDRISLLPNVADAISLFRNLGYKIIIVTNQSCVGRGYTTLDEVIKTNERLNQLLILSNKNALIDKIQIAPEHPSTENSRRKPSSKMIDECIDLFQLDIKKCWIIGDRESDCLAGVNAGLPFSQCILVKKNQVESFKSDFTLFNSLSDAANHIEALES